MPTRSVVRSLVTLGLLTLAGLAVQARSGAPPDDAVDPTLADPAPVDAAADPADAVAALIAEFASDDWRRREAAELALVPYGDLAKEQLAPLIESGDPESRARAQSVLRRIAEEEQFGPTRITLTAGPAAADARQVLAELAAQAGVAIDDDRGELWGERQSWPVADGLRVERQPFWVAVHRVCATAGLQAEMPGGPGTLRLEESEDWGALPVCEAGPFMVMARHVSVELDRKLVRRGGDWAPARNGSAVHLSVYADTRLKILRRVRLATTVSRMVDEQGRRLLPELHEPGGDDEWDGDQYWEHDSGWSWGGRVPLADPGTAERIALLEGEVAVIVSVGSEVGEVEDVVGAAGEELTVAGYVVRVEGVDQSADGRGYSFDLRIGRNGRPAEDWERLKQVLSGDEFRLVARGPRVGLDHSYVQPVDGGGEWFQVGVSFLQAMGSRQKGDEDKPEQPKLVIELPTETRYVSARYKFTDLPLP